MDLKCLPSNIFAKRLTLQPGTFKKCSGLFFMITRKNSKLIQSLRHGKFRKKHRLFVAEGTKMVLELLRSDFQLEALYATSGWVQRHAAAIKPVESKLYQVSQKDLDSLSNLATPPDVLAVIAIPGEVFHAESLRGKTTLVLDGINDPGNMGTIIRTADWFGVNQVLCSQNSVDPYHPKVVQATMGSLFRLSIFETDLLSILAEAADDLPVYGAFLDGSSIWETRLIKEAIYIIGSESHGISLPVARFVGKRIMIPQPACKNNATRVESLNAAVASAIILAEMQRTEP